jgi:hypothetical protein
MRCPGEAHSVVPSAGQWALTPRGSAQHTTVSALHLVLEVFHLSLEMVSVIVTWELNMGNEWKIRENIHLGKVEEEV